jgi:hypothetical protein
MPIVQTKVQAITSSSNSHQVQFAAPVTLGNWVVIIWRQFTTGRTPGVPSPAAGTWSGVQDFLATPGGTSGRIYCWSAQQTGAATDTYTITISGGLTGLGGIVAYELSGVDVTGTPRGASGTQTLSSTTSWKLIASPGISLTSGDVIIGAAGVDAASWGTLTAPSGFDTEHSSTVSPWTSTWVGDRTTAGSGITGAASNTTSRVIYTGYQVYLQASSGTSISVSDSGSGSDAAPSISCSLSQEETSSGTDGSPSISCSLSQADSGAGLDSAPSCSVSLSLLESSQASDFLGTLDVLLAAITDSGSGSDFVAQIQQGILIAIAEAGLGTDAITNLACSLSTADDCTGADEAAVSVQLQQILDACVGSDTVECAASLSLIETAAGVEAVACSVQLSLSDSATGLDLLTSLAAVIAIAEQCNGIDTINVQTGSASSGRVATISFTAQAKSAAFAPAAKSATFTPTT